MLTRSIKRRLLKAKISLSNTIQQILDINQQRKKLHFFENAHLQRELLEDELRVLNKVAEQQAKLIQSYEKVLSTKDKD